MKILGRDRNCRSDVEGKRAYTFVDASPVVEVLACAVGFPCCVFFDTLSTCLKVAKVVYEHIEVMCLKSRRGEAGFCHT